MRIKPVVVFVAVPVSIIALFVLFLLLTGGGMDYEIKLPNHYSLVRVYSNCHVLVTPTGSGAVEPTIDHYRVLGEIVVGHVSRERDFSDSRLGYFCVDTKTGKVNDGLSKSKWLSVLRGYGIEREPKLKRPNRLQALGNLFRD